MTIREGILFPVIWVFVILVFPIPIWAGEGTVKIPSLQQTCEEYSDEPMIADDLYEGKTIETSIKVTSKRKIPSICSDAEEGTFTAEFVTASYVVQCVCNPPPSKRVFDTINGGDVFSIIGTFKSMTSTFFEGDTKMCQVTIYGCALKLGNK